MAAVISPRPCHAPDKPLFTVETNDNVEESGIKSDDRAGTWHGHEMNWAPK